MQLFNSPNTTTIVNKKEHLYFSGTSYLGASAHPFFQQNLLESIKKWGISYGSSRAANLKLSVYKKAENYFAEFLQKEAAITISSGTLAGVFAIKTLEQYIDYFFYMPKTHPAILSKKADAVFINNNLNPLLLKKNIGHICILADAIATLENLTFSFDFLNQIPTNTNITILIDESHSLGILGVHGAGISEQFSQIKNVEVIVVSSLGKAYGINGGLIAGSALFISKIQQDPLFIGSAGMSPAFLDCFMQSQKFYQGQLQKLKKNCRLAYKALGSFSEINISKNYPVFFVDNPKISDFLLSKQIVITSFYYATSPKKINRIVLNANHSKLQIEELVKNLITFHKS